MDDQKQLEDRWRELDELLGLGSGTPPAAKTEKPAAPEPKPEAPAIRAYEEPPSLRKHEPVEEEATPLAAEIEHEIPSIPMIREEPTTDWESEFEEDEDDTPLDESEEPRVDEPGTTAGEPAGAPGVAGEEEKPRRGRRRRRRGRRRGGADRPEGEGQEARPPAAAAPARKPLPEKAPAPRPSRAPVPEPRESRGRSQRGRREEEELPRKRPIVDELADEDTEVEETPNEPVASRNAAHDDDTDFSNWTVPPWQELISSLYRPDR